MAHINSFPFPFQEPCFTGSFVNSLDVGHSFVIDTHILK